MRKTLPSMPRLAPAAALLLLGACIVRPASTEEARRTFDRSGLGDVILEAAPEHLHESQARWDDGARLLGWRAEPERPAPGTRVTITFYWQAVEDPQDDWKVFVHMEPIGVTGSRINGDHEPASGRYPTRVWREGDIVRDTFHVSIPGYLQTTGIEIWTGLYRGDTRQGLLPRPGVRSDGQNRAMVGVLPLAAH